MRLVGLYREAECSPGRHRSNDAALLDRVAEVLRAHGCDVELRTLPTAAPSRRPDGLVFSMCQGRSSLELLTRWEDEGARVVNTPRAALNTYRDRLSGLMQAAGIPFPTTTLVTTSKGGDAGVDVNGGLWLKRGDMHASVRADVQWIDSADRLRAGLKEFAARGIARAALQPHCEGDEIKFYGVTGGRFFQWFYPEGDAEPVRGAGRYPLDVLALEQLTERAAGAAGLDIFGGDVIVGPSGELTLIDLNDWPSFAPCRDRAADAIAGHLMGYLNVAWNPGLVSRSNENAV
jgi:hypothetical protein